MGACAPDRVSARPTPGLTGFRNILYSAVGMARARAIKDWETLAGGRGLGMEERAQVPHKHKLNRSLPKNLIGNFNEVQNPKRHIILPSRRTLVTMSHVVFFSRPLVLPCDRHLPGNEGLSAGLPSGRGGGHAEPCAASAEFPVRVSRPQHIGGSAKLPGARFAQ